MGNALTSGVSGLKAHQTMIDVAGNNLANVNTTGFKSSRVTFAELLSQTLKDASAPTANLGGTNPMQVGNGVLLGSVDKDMTQGTLEYTGNSMDMAIDGNGYFTLNDGLGDRYTRVGQFAVDSQFYLIDPTTGYRVQRLGREGVAEGFQDPTSNDIRIPYDVALAAQQSTSMSFSGNLTANQSSPSLHQLSSDLQYTDATGSLASYPTLLSALSQASGIAAGDTITITGNQKDGTAVNADYTYAAGDTMQDLLDRITDLYGGAGGTLGSTATLVNGQIRMLDNTSGYSQAFIASMTYTDISAGGDTFTLPTQFDILTAGGQVEKPVNVEVFDAQGNAYTVAGSFVRTDTTNTWDFVVKSVSGATIVDDRFCRGIQFQTDGSYGDMDGNDANGNTITLSFPSDPTNQRTITLDLGTLGELNGLTQFGGPSTAANSGQDGYAAGWLSTMSVSREGTLVGVFSNGVRRDIAALKIATFQNPAGLKSVGGNYFLPSANSGDPVPNKATEGDAGNVNGGSIEKSNVEVAREFVNLITAQNGYQANARTIKVANEMLRELTNLIR